MSVMLILLPAAYLAPVAVAASAAAVKAIEERNAANGLVRVETRMKNTSMVAEALTNMGFKVEVAEQEIIGSSKTSNIKMFKNSDQLWVGQFSGNIDENIAVNTLQTLDREYGKLVQKALIEKLHSRVAQSNMEVLDQVTNSDQSITLTLGVNA